MNPTSKGKSKYYFTNPLRERLLAEETGGDIVFETVEEILAHAKPRSLGVNRRIPPCH